MYGRPMAMQRSGGRNEGTGTGPPSVTMQLGDQWEVVMTWGNDSSGPRTLTIRPAGPSTDGVITPGLLREISFTEAYQQLHNRLAASQDTPDVPAGQWDEAIRQSLAEGVTDPYLALLSARYVALTNEGTRNPLQALAEITGKTPSTMKNHLWQARTKRDLLVGTHGRAGGVLTGRAVKLLQSNAPELWKDIHDHSWTMGDAVAPKLP